jgi:hypothetical protein
MFLLTAAEQGGTSDSELQKGHTCLLGAAEQGGAAAQSNDG